mmetsp:Transcript_55275/g.124525  ORF Transcript_55275/g.124525 Transcript_55275/m.124525 type:complete len:249 (+) Transcript_55275:90-836(+)
METLRRAFARMCGMLPGTIGLAGYFLCCVLPCKRCRRSGGVRSGGGASGKGSDEEAALLPSKGMQQVVLVGLDGAGKSSFLWMCEHPGDSQLPAPGALKPTVGVLRLMRKGVPSAERGCLVDLDLSEVGGAEKIRPFWPHYITREVRALAFLVSATAPERLDEAAAQFVTVCDAFQSRTPFARFVLVASHSDAPGASSAEEIHTAIRSRVGNAVDFDCVTCTELALHGAHARASCDALLRILARLAVE